MLHVIVADDEKIARERLTRLLHETGQAAVIAECAGGEAAVAQTIALEPDVLFLDVQMPDLDGFGVLRELAGRVSPTIVFVTAFDQYAVRAFDVHAVDYLLKPYTVERFRQTFARAASAAAGGGPDETRLRALLNEYLTGSNGGGSGNAFIDRVAVKVDGALRIVRLADVDWWETDGNYMRLHIGPKSQLVRMTASSLEAQLDPRQFVRIHRRFIVNMDRIVEIQPWFAGDAVVLLRGGAKLRLSRTHRDRLHSRLLGTRGEPAE